MSVIYGHGADFVQPGMNYAAYGLAGLHFAMRYVVPSIPGKMLTLKEAAEAHSQGIDLGFVYETTGTTWQGGHDAGYADGIRAYGALRSLGVPFSAGCFHAVDSPVPKFAMGAVIEWMRGVLLGMRDYRTGVYGDYDVIKAIAASYPQVFRWQTKAWSGGNIASDAALLQLGSTTIAGINADFDVAYQPHFGQWYADPRNQPHTLNGDEMISGQISAASIMGVPVDPGTAQRVTLYADISRNGDFEQSVRVACHSAQHGYNQIVTVKLLTSEPFVITLTEQDVNAISFDRRDGADMLPIGYLVS